MVDAGGPLVWSESWASSPSPHGDSLLGRLHGVVTEPCACDGHDVHCCWWPRSLRAPARTARHPRQVRRGHPRRHRRRERGVRAGARGRRRSRLAAVFTEDGEVIPAMERGFVSGRTEIEAYNARRLTASRYLDVVITTVQLGVSGDLAWETGTSRVTMQHGNERARDGDRSLPRRMEARPRRALAYSGGFTHRRSCSVSAPRRSSAPVSRAPQGPLLPCSAERSSAPHRSEEKGNDESHARRRRPRAARHRLRHERLGQEAGRPALPLGSPPWSPNSRT